MERPEIRVTRITDKNLKKLSWHLYRIDSARGCFHVDHDDLAALYEQLKVLFEGINDEVQVGALRALTKKSQAGGK